MIEIRLTGEDALEYIQFKMSNKRSNERSIENNTNILNNENNSLEAIKQANIANEINKKSKRWNNTEIKAIEWAMKQPENTSHRQFKVLVNRLGRTEMSVYSKLNELGISVKNGKLYYKENK